MDGRTDIWTYIRIDIQSDMPMPVPMTVDRKTGREVVAMFRLRCV